VIPVSSQDTEGRHPAELWWRRTGITAVLSLTVLALLTIVFASGKLHSLLGRQAENKALPTPVVLPFDGLSNDPAQNYIAEGMTEQLITELRKSQELRIVSRVSVMKFERNHASLEAVAQDLHEDYVFEGSVTESGGNLRVTGNLYQVAARKHLWAETYQRAVRDRLSPQREIILDVAQNIQANLSLQEVPQRSLPKKLRRSGDRGSPPAKVSKKL
jgi:TolB-like protein